MKAKKMLLIVDPQIDFITGSLPVPQAQAAMGELGKYIFDNDGNYCCKIVTTDWHPYAHCSFQPQGGEWPIHCVNNSVGAAIYPSLIAPLNETLGFYKVLRKGVYEHREEYSIFKNLASANYLRQIISMLNITQIDICGIAGDICVLDTLKDGIELYGKKIFCVLTDYSPSLDGGKKLQAFIEDNGISHKCRS